MTRVTREATYEIIQRGGYTGIYCKRCGRESWSPNDLKHLYCVYCDKFHDDVWPPVTPREEEK